MRTLILFLLAAVSGAAADTYLPWEGGPAYYKQWRNGPSADDSYFPIAVWLQSPRNAEAYKAIGINLYVGLWRGPTEEQLKALADAEMPVLAGMKEGLTDSGVLRGWTMMDEPDNAQAKPGGGYGSCVLPATIAEQYRKWKTADPTRPVYLNLGQGVVNEKYAGRGSVCARHDEHYAEYIAATDIVSYDVYPVNSKYPLWWVGAGIDRLRKWANYEKPVWNWIEASTIRGEGKPTPAQLKSEVWMSIIHGSMGIGYFCHQFKPKSDESAPLHDPEIRQAMKEINGRITELARVLNTRSVADGVTVASSNAEVPIDTMLKRYGGETYLFAMGARPGGETVGKFQLRDIGNAVVTVIGEDRTIKARRGGFEDRFGEYEVHLYRIKN